MLLADFRLEHRRSFHSGGLFGEGFVDAGGITLDFDQMRLVLRS
jgi:hypothetical protein